MISVSFTRLHDKATVPAYQTQGSAGLDVSACLEKSITIAPQEIILVPTGIAIELPEGYEAQLRPRSGLALKHGISLPNTPATIDSDYRGEIKVILINLGKSAFEINHGDRIAQMIIAKVERIILTEKKTLSTTKRGEGGFGHTGV